MSTTNFVSIGGFILAIPQTLVALIQLVNLRKKSPAQSKQLRVFLTILLAVGTTSIHLFWSVGLEPSSAADNRPLSNHRADKRSRNGSGRARRICSFG